VDREFLLKIMEMWGFSPRRMSIVKGVLHNGSVGVRINELEGDFILTGKGLRQGDPLAPLLFNTTMDVFSKMLIKGCEACLVSGLCS
jgi:hypothetical protein